MRFLAQESRLRIDGVSEDLVCFGQVFDAVVFFYLAPVGLLEPNEELVKIELERIDLLGERLGGVLHDALDTLFDRGEVFFGEQMGVFDVQGAQQLLQLSV